MSREIVKFIEYTPLNKETHEYEVRHENDYLLGYLEQIESGFYEFWNIGDCGYLPSYLLRAIADKLDELNAPFEAQMNEYFEQERLREIREHQRRIEEL